MFKLVARRKELGLTQVEIAKAVGCSPSTWRTIEAGDQRLDIDRFATACRVLKLSADELLGIPNNAPKRPGKLSPIEQIARRRRELDISRLEIAEHLGTTESAWKAVERGEVRLTVDRLEIVCKRLGLSADRLLGIKKARRL